MIMDIPLKADHPRYKTQKNFFEFQKEYPTLKVETADLYNDGGYVSIHFDKDEFVVLCDTDEKTMEFSILVDYESAEFEIIETVAFDWDLLKSRLNDMLTLSPWTETFIDEPSENEARKKAIEFLRKRWKTK